jgi:hypothetical protein
MRRERCCGPRRTLLLALLLVVAVGSGAKAPRLRLLVNGREVPAQRAGTGALARMSALAGALGAALRPDPKKPGVVYVIAGERWAQFTVGSKQVVVRPDRSRSQSRIVLLDAPPVLREGAIWVPLSAAKALGASVAGPDAAGVLRVRSGGEEDETGRWSRLLGISDTGPFRRGGLLIRRMKIAYVGSLARVGTEMVVNLTLSAPGYVQIYEVRGGSVEPMLGVDEDGAIMLYPERWRRKPAPMKVEDRLRLPIRATDPGSLTLVAVATAAPIEADPRELLRGGASGAWAISGASVQVRAPAPER